MHSYATLRQLRRYLGLADSQTADDALLSEMLGAAARLLERDAGRRFYPVRATHVYDYQAPGTLLLRDDLLALHGLTNGDDQPIALAHVHLEPPGGPTFARLRLDRTRAAFTYRDNPHGAIAVEGTWGCHPEWPDAWRDSGAALLDAPLTAGAATIHAAGAGAAFEIGQLVRLDDEYAAVLDVAPDALTVLRGANGTTAPEHAAGTAIAIYVPPADVTQVCLRVASWLYRQKDAGWVQAARGLRGQVTVPAALPEDVRQVLAPYRRIRVA